jgi:hypothetical protein
MERRRDATPQPVMASLPSTSTWNGASVIRRPMYAVALLTASLYTAFLDVFDYYGSIIRATGRAQW